MTHVLISFSNVNHFAATCQGFLCNSKLSSFQQTLSVPTNAQICYYVFHSQLLHVSA